MPSKITGVGAVAWWVTPDASVGPVYLDPPFNSNVDYNVRFREEDGERSAAQITAFEDSWHWVMEAEAAWRAAVSDGPGRLSELPRSLVAARFSRPQRYDGLSDDDGAAPCRTASRPQAWQQHLPALRPYCQPLPQVTDGRHIGPAQFLQRNHPALPEMGHQQIHFSAQSRCNPAPLSNRSPNLACSCKTRPLYDSGR